MPEVHSRHTGLRMVLVDYLLKTKKEYKKLKKQKIHEIFIGTNSTKVTYTRTSLMEIVKIYLEQLLLINHYKRKRIAENNSFEKPKIYSCFKCNICGADLGHM